MLDLSALQSSFQPGAFGFTSPQALQKQQLDMQDTQSQIDERKAIAQKDQAGQKQMLAAQQILADPANYDANGRLTQSAVTKGMGVHPSMFNDIQKNYNEWDNAKAKNEIDRQKNETEALSASTKANEAVETARHNKAEETKLDPAEQDYQNYLKSAGLPDNAASRFKFKAQGTKLSPGESIMDESGTAPAYTAPRVQVPGVDVPFNPDVEKQKIDIAHAEKVDPEQVVTGQDADGKPQFFVINKATGAQRPIAGITPKVGPSDAPSQLKDQVAGALQTQAKVDTIRALQKANPNVMGAVAGRVNEAGQIVGTNPLNTPKDNQDAAELAGALSYLYANEVKASSSGGRPNPAVVKRLADVSAKMKDDPNILEGFLKAAEKNSNDAIDTGATYRIPEAVAAQAKRSVNVQIPGHAPGKIPASALDQFMKDNPGATRLP